MNITENHQLAMDFAAKAILAENKLESAILYRKAFWYERRAAVFGCLNNEEPTRSVLLRSAASLAMDCKDFNEAKRLAKIGLEGNPPTEIKEELEEILVKEKWELET